MAREIVNANANTSYIDLYMRMKNPQRSREYEINKEKNPIHTCIIAYNNNNNKGRMCRILSTHRETTKLNVCTEKKKLYC